MTTAVGAPAQAPGDTGINLLSCKPINRGRLNLFAKGSAYTADDSAFFAMFDSARKILGPP
jgi:hypothetical protein